MKRFDYLLKRFIKQTVYLARKWNEAFPFNKSNAVSQKNYPGHNIPESFPTVGRHRLDLARFHELQDDGSQIF